MSTPSSTLPSSFTPQRLLHLAWRTLLSVQLTVACLVLATVLVFIGTLAQVRLGIHAAQAAYFQTFFVWWTPEDWTISFPVFPGGYLIGTLMLANLICSHVWRFQWKWQKSGIWLTHAGLIVLLTSGLLTDLFSVESVMSIDVGDKKNYSESQRYAELAIVDVSRPDVDRVIAIPESMLANNVELRDERMPFTVRVVRYFPNAALLRLDPGQAPMPELAQAQGMGRSLRILPRPLAAGQKDVNNPTAIIELRTPEGSLGTWLVSRILFMPETFTYQGRGYRLSMRWARIYHPFELALLKFTHDKYPGTEIPRNFASTVRVQQAATHEDREALIYMNNPLRYAGLTFYQSGFDNADQTSILQVVRNPNWLMPYFACGLISLGLLLQFSLHLVLFLRQRADSSKGASLSATTASAKPSALA